MLDEYDHMGIGKTPRGGKRTHHSADVVVLDAPPLEPLPLRFIRRTESDLANQPARVWQVEDALPVGGFGMWFGMSGAFKTTLALDFALCTQLGMRWHGHRVRQGPVIYVMGEGIWGAHARLEAWKLSRGVQADTGLTIVDEPVNLSVDTEVDEFIRTCVEGGPMPALCIFDTLSRCSAGNDENDATARGLIVRNSQRISKATGAAVLLLHHPGKDGESVERGSVVLRQAADWVLSISRGEGMSVRVGRGPTFDKVKDAADWTPFSRAVEVVGQSVVVGVSPLMQNGASFTAHETEALISVSGSFMSEGATFNSWREATPKVPKGSFARARTSLVGRRCVERYTRGKVDWYRITPDGLAILAEQFRCITEFQDA